MAVRKFLVLTNYHSHKYNFSLKNDYYFSKLRAFFLVVIAGGRKKTHSTHFIDSYMASDIW